MTNEKTVVLLIEDEPQMRRFLRITLEGHGYRLIEAQSGQEGLTEAATRSPDVVLLDLGLPDMDGLEVTTAIREWSGVPIIVLSARDREDDKIRALDAGADDYLTKPFGAGELLARIRVALRHLSLQQAGGEDPVFALGNLRVDFAKRQVLRDGREVHLTPIEYKLLATLIRHAGKVITHTLLMKEVWGSGYSDQTHYLRIYMAQLRHKLEADPARPRFLINEPGIGYRLRIEQEEDR
ncbi:MAG: response regulator [Nitrospiraceae bacterium]|nr:response regulator [Nitrospiraceae bacterium]